jgi:O-antigen ligase
LTLIISLLLLLVRFEAVIYGIVTASVLLVDGWLMTRSPEDTPFRMGIGRLYLLEIPIYLLFLAYLKRRWGARKERASDGIFVSTPLDLPLRGWLVAFPLFALYGLLRGNPLQDAVGYFEWRCLFIAILFYFLVSSLFREYKDLRRLWRWFFIIASAKAFYSLVLVITKIDPPLPLVFGQGPVGEGVENALYLFAALPALAILLFHAEKEPKWRAMLLFGAFTMIADVAHSEKRDPQLALLVGLAILGWHLPRRDKIRWGLRIACFALLLVLSRLLMNLRSGTFGIGASFSRYNEIVEFVQAPGETISAGDTFAFHLFDFIDGWGKVKELPLLGQGFGGQTERNLTLLPIAGGADVGTGMIHNQYLTFWLKMGVAGPILMLWLLGRFFLQCHRKLKCPCQTFASALAVGICAAFWADVAMEFWGCGWIGNTKMPIVIFLSMALAMGFLRCCSEDTASASGEGHA